MAAGATVEEFSDLLSGRKGQPPKRKQIPLLGLARAGKGGSLTIRVFPSATAGMKSTFRG